MNIVSEIVFPEPECARAHERLQVPPLVIRRKPAAANNLTTFAYLGVYRSGDGLLWCGWVLRTGRRRDQGKKGKKGKKGDLNDSDNGTTEINIKVNGKGKGGGRSTAKGAKRKGAGKKGHVESDEWSDDSAEKTSVRVKSSARASRASSASKGKRKGQALSLIHI